MVIVYEWKYENKRWSYSSGSGLDYYCESGDFTDTLIPDKN